MNINTANSLLFVTAGLTPFIVYLGLGPDGAAILDQARAEQFFAYLFFGISRYLSCQLFSLSS